MVPTDWTVRLAMFQILRQVHIRPNATSIYYFVDDLKIRLESHAFEDLDEQRACTLSIDEHLCRPRY